MSDDLYQQVADKVLAEPLCRIKVRGREQELLVHRLIGLTDEAASSGELRFRAEARVRGVAACRRRRQGGELHPGAGGGGSRAFWPLFARDRRTDVLVRSRGCAPLHSEHLEGLYVSHGASALGGFVR